MSVQQGSISLSNHEIQLSTPSGGNQNREWRRFKPETNHSYRIHLLSTDFEYRKRHFNPQDKRYYKCLGDTGYCPICLAASNHIGGDGQFKIRKASDTFGANILVYDTDDYGNIKQPLNAEVYFWSFGTDKFVMLRDLQDARGDITKLDLKVTCTDGQFQKLTFIDYPADQCFYLTDANFKAVCDEKIKNDSYNLGKMLCHDADLKTVVSVFKLSPDYLTGNVTSAPVMNQAMPQQNYAPQQGMPVQGMPQQNYAPNMQSQVIPQQGMAQPQMGAQPTMAQPNMAQPTAPAPQASAGDFADLSELQNLLN